VFKAAHFVHVQTEEDKANNLLKDKMSLEIYTWLRAGTTHQK
jgi:hypothetical protein